MAYAANTSRKIPAGTPNTHTYGAAIDARDYGPGVNGGVMGWFTHVAASTGLEYLDMYVESGEVLSLYDDYFADIPAQSGPRIIRPAGLPNEASWQGHDGTPFRGVGFAPTTGATSWAYEIDQPGIRIFDLILKGVSGKRCVYIGSISGTAHLVGNIMQRVGTTPTSASQNAVGGYAPSCQLYMVNNIIDGFYEGVRGEFANTSVVYNNTFVNLISRAIFADTNTGTRLYAYCYNNAYYNCGATSSYPAGQSGTNVTLNASSDLADYANQDYRLSPTASEALGQGTDMSANAYYAFADDLDNVAVTTWNIGAGANLVAEYHLNATSSWHLIAALTATSSWNIYGSVAISTNFSEYYRTSIFDAIFGISPFLPVPPYLALADESSIEPEGGGYARTLVTPWGTPALGVVSNSATVRSPRASASWGILSRFLLTDSAAAGNQLGAGELTTPLDVTGGAEGGLFVFFPAGEIEMSLTGNMFHGFANSVLSALVNGTTIPTGAVTVGLTTGALPTRAGVYTEVSATGYSRASITVTVEDGLYNNATDAEFPVVQSGHDWGTVTGFVLFVGGAAFAFGALDSEVIDYATYGSEGFLLPAQTIVVEVI